MIYIGIDPGSTTGIATWYSFPRQDLYINQFKSHCEAIMHIRNVATVAQNSNVPLKIIIEDARLAKKRPDLAQVNAGKAQGVGYVKAYSKDWEAFCKLLGLQYELRPPSNTKTSPEYFEALTGLKTLKTQSHLRDAAMLVYGR